MKSKISALLLSVTMFLSLCPFTLNIHASSVPEASSLISVDELHPAITEDNITDLGHVQRLSSADLDTVRYQNANGTITVYQFSENICYLDDSGNVCDKSNQLFRQSDGSYVNRYNDIRVSFPSKISKGVSVSYDDMSLLMTPYEDSSLSKLATSEIAIIPSNSRVTINEVKYSNVFDSDVDIIYTPNFSGVKEDIILPERPLTNQFSFVIKTLNVSLNNKETYIEILDQSDSLVGIISPITVISSNNLFSDGTYTVTPITTNNVVGDNAYKVTIILESEFLNSPDVLYPITVDPTITINALEGSTKQIYDATLYEKQSSYSTGHIEYNKINLGISFTSSSISNRESLIDDCPSNVNTPCSSDTCGENCYTQHHRNIDRYANDIYSLSNSANQIYIAWDYADNESLCSSKTSTHHAFQAMGCVAQMPTTNERGIIVPNKYWDGMNAMLIFEPSLQFQSAFYPTSMKLIAAHEMAHVMGINDTYGNGGDANHSVDSEVWTCIMRSFNKSPAGQTYANAVQNGTADPFCSYCENLIASVIQTRYFPAS